MTDPDGEDDGNRCGVDGRRLTPGWTLCQRCSDNLAADLTEITTRYRRLDTRPGANLGEQTRRPKPGSRPPLRLDVVALRDYRSKPEPGTREAPSVARELDHWVSIIRRERGYASRPDPYVDDLAEFIARHDDHISRADYGPQLAQAVRALRNVLRSATGEPNRPPIAACLRYIDAQGTECGAAIYWDPDGTPPLIDGVPGVRCSRPRTEGGSHAYTGADLLRLAAVNFERGSSAS